MPRPTLRILDVMALTVGLVLGAGIFKAPSVVAANASGAAPLLLAWLLGGLLSLVGALCYAELATTYPHAGGDYHYLGRALGRDVAFLFAWARLTVIPTGSIALLAFVFGDYASQLWRLGPHSTSLYAAGSVVLLTAINVAGVRLGKRTQNVLTVLEVLGVVLIIAVGLWVTPGGASTPVVTGVASVSAGGEVPGSTGAWGVMMIFVLLTYGGWNEVAYLSSEVQNPARNLVRALAWSVGLITALYLLLNLAFLRVLGHAAMGRSEAVATDFMRQTLGEGGARLLSLLIAVSALTSTSATIITAARTNYAFGRDSSLFAGLGRWHPRRDGPTRALLVQGLIVLALILLGTVTRQGFQTMVEYTTPVFWLFFLLTGVSLMVLRRREPGVQRPFRVPLYPLTPLLFCASSAYLLYASLAYTGLGSLAGVAVLAVGGCVLVMERRRRSSTEARREPLEAT